MTFRKRINDLWERNKDKIFFTLSIEIINNGGKFMWKKFIHWVGGIIKAEAITLIKSQQDEIAELIRRNSNPDIVARNIVNWLCDKIEKI